MSGELLRDILTFVIAIAIVVIGATAITLWNRRKKTQSYEAKIIKKEIDMNMLSTQFPRVPRCMLEFLILDSHKKMKFAVSEKYYSSSPENVKGTLCIRGTELLSFKGEDFNIDCNA